MYYHTSPSILAAFHGKLPRMYMRMLSGRSSAWGDAARAPREQVQAVLRSIGLEMKLVVKEMRFRARPGKRRGVPYTYPVGELVSISV